MFNLILRVKLKECYHQIDYNFGVKLKLTSGVT